MTMRSRKFLGMFVLVGFIVAYAATVVVLAVDRLGETHKLVELIFYIAAGIAWIFPARLIIAWMQRPDS